MRRSTNIYINTLRTFFITSEKNMKMTRWSSLKTTLVNWIKNRMNQLAMHIQNAGMHRTRTMMKRWLQRDLSTRVAIWREGCELFVGAMGRLKIRIYHWLESQLGVRFAIWRQRMLLEHSEMKKRLSELDNAKIICTNVMNSLMRGSVRRVVAFWRMNMMHGRYSTDIEGMKAPPCNRTPSIHHILKQIWIVT